MCVAGEMVLSSCRRMPVVPVCSAGTPNGQLGVRAGAQTLCRAGGEGEHGGGQECLCCWLPVCRLNFSLQMNIFLFLLLK